MIKFIMPTLAPSQANLMPGDTLNIEDARTRAGEPPVVSLRLRERRHWWGSSYHEVTVLLRHDP